MQGCLQMLVKFSDGQAKFSGAMRPAPPLLLIILRLIYNINWYRIEITRNNFKIFQFALMNYSFIIF